MIENLAEFVNGNDALVRRGRFVECAILVGVGEVDYIVRIDRGRVSDVRRRGISIESGRFTIRAPAKVWREHWQPMPKRDHHDLFSMLAAGLAHIDGDLLPFMQNLLYFKDLLAAPRSARAAG
ncbi:MAG: hypothetical protein ACR2PM_02710 [Hyphomicrobiales bacterium]